MKAIPVLIAFLLLGFLIPSQAWAVRGIIISSDKTSLSGEEFATISASSSGFTNGETIYIKGAFYQDGSTNYLGYTKNGDNWIKNGESTLSQRSIIVGSWDNALVIKSDFVDSGFTGEGTYKFKVGFYYITSGGNISSINWSSNSLDMVLNEPDPSPTSTPTLTPIPTPTLKPTNTSTPSVTNTPTVTKTVSKTPTPTPFIPSKAEEVLGNSTNSAKDNKIEVKKEEDVKEVQVNKNYFPIIFISIGVVFLLACAIVFFYPKIKDLLNHGNE